MSVAPVVANVRAEQYAAGQTVTPQTTSPRKAGLIGAAIGLAFVSLFVVGARLAYRGAPRADDAKSVALPAPSQPRDLPPPTTAGTAATMGTAVLVAPAVAPPVVAPPASPVVREPPRRTAPRPSLPAAAMGAPKPSRQAADPSVEGPSAPATVAASPAPTTSAGQAETADSANSLIPVIPSSPPPEVDPLVKAVLDEDDSQHK